MILYLLLLLPVVWLVVFKYRRRRMHMLARLVPGSGKDVPLTGIAHKLTGNTEDIMLTLQDFSYGSMRNGGILREWFGHILYFLVVDPVDNEMVLKTCMEKDNLHRFLMKLLGNGSIFAAVPIWRKRRKIIVPAFSPKIVDNFVEVFSEQSEKLAKLLHSHANGEPFSIWPFLSSYTLDSICETVMGVKMNSQANRNSPFLQAMNRILNIVSERIFHLWLQPDWLFKFFPQYPVHQKCIQLMHGFTDEVIRKKREDLQTEQSNTEFNVIRSYQRKTFLDLLISLSGGDKGFNDVELREEVVTLTIAGTDTSAVAVGYTLKLLAQFPDVQEKVFQELHDVFGDSERPLEKFDLLKLKYLERVVKESMRLFPPVPFIIRKVLEETKLPSGYVLPAGSGVVVSIWGAHRDPKYWGPDAEHFDPDRFLPERFNLEHSCSYMPFSNGPRNCVGYQYALMSVKTALSVILRRFKVVGDKETTPTPHIRVKLDIMMKAVDGYQVALERRKPDGPTISNGHHA